MIGKMIALALLAGSGQATSASAMIDRPADTPKVLFQAASRANGFWLCDNRLKSQQAREFDRRYGKRVLQLANAIITREGLGWGPDDILLLPCARVDNTSKGRRELAAGLDEFESTLRTLEARYGIEPPK